MFGCWVVFQYNGEEEVPDLSIPITVKKYPRGSIRLSDVESSRVWHDCNVGYAKSLELGLKRVVGGING